MYVFPIYNSKQLIYNSNYYELIVVIKKYLNLLIQVKIKSNLLSKIIINSINLITINSTNLKINNFYIVNLMSNSKIKIYEIGSK
jgi:hypothetical protein